MGEIRSTNDDKFLVSKDAISIVKQKMRFKVAAHSFSPRTRWQFQINGHLHKPIGSYCVLLSRKILEKEKLPLKPVKGVNRHKGPAGTYDTLDYANEQLLQKGYILEVSPDNGYITGFDGTSNGRILASKLLRKEIKEILLKPDTSARYLRWWGAMAWGLYAVGCVVVLHKKLLGKPATLDLPIGLEEIENLVNESSMPDSGLRDLVSIKFQRNTGKSLRDW